MAEGVGAGEAGTRCDGDAGFYPDEVLAAEQFVGVLPLDWADCVVGGRYGRFVALCGNDFMEEGQGQADHGQGTHVQGGRFCYLTGKTMRITVFCVLKTQ